VITDYAALRPLRAGLVAWPDGRATVVVKLTFALSNEGTFCLAEDQDALSLDVSDPSGELIYPSDFAPYKPVCDVAVVGQAALERSEPGRLTAGAVWRTVEPHETLGPRETFCPRGDPTDPTVIGLWSTGKVDFARFQMAPPDRRMPWPAQRFTVEYQRGAMRIGGRFDGPIPRACLLRDTSVIVAKVALSLDSVLIDPLLRRTWMLFRGVHAPAHVKDADATARCIIDLSSTPTLDPRIVGRWSPSTLATPATAMTPIMATPLERVGASIPSADFVVDTTARLVQPAAGPALPFAARANEPAASPARARRDEPRHTFDDDTAPALHGTDAFPFANRENGPRTGRPLSQQDLEELRQHAAEPVAPAWEAGSKTRFLAASRSGARVAPFDLSPVVSLPSPATVATTDPLQELVSDGGAARRAPSEVPIAAATAEPSQADTSPPIEPRTEVRPSLQRYAAIRVAIETGTSIGAATASCGIETASWSKHHRRTLHRARVEPGFERELASALAEARREYARLAIKPSGSETRP